MFMLEDLLKEQDYHCLLCGKSFVKGAKNCAVMDHNHETGIVRGAVHNSCNRKIGVFETRKRRPLKNPNNVLMIRNYFDKTRESALKFEDYVGSCNSEYGRPIETRKKMSKSQKGHIVSIETRRKLSEAIKKVAKENPGIFTHKHSEETKQKLSNITREHHMKCKWLKYIAGEKDIWNLVSKNKVQKRDKISS